MQVVHGRHAPQLDRVHEPDPLLLFARLRGQQLRGQRPSLVLLPLTLFQGASSPNKLLFQVPIQPLSLVLDADIARGPEDKVLDRLLDRERVVVQAEG